MIEEILLGFFQAFLSLFIGLIVWVTYRFYHRKSEKIVSFPQFLGLYRRGFRWTNKFSKIYFGVLLLGVFSTLLQYLFVAEFIEFSKSESSPFWKILKNGLHVESLVLAVSYCAITTGFTEEVIFRGIIAKRLIAFLGFRWGNICQALFFWFIHFFLLGMVTNSWFSLLQLFVVISIFPVGLVLGYTNEIMNGGSIVPSWILHASMNLITFVLLAFFLMWP